MSSTLINNIILQKQRLATHSWEYGALAEVLLEWYTPNASVFGGNPFPDGRIPVIQVDTTPSLSYVKRHISTNSDTLIDGDGMLLRKEDPVTGIFPPFHQTSSLAGAAGGPASLGVYAILIGQTQDDYLSAAEPQVNYLLTAVPRYTNGAISHRESVAELWADFIYMAPPTLAYWAIQTDDAGLLATALQQCILYRDVLGVPANAKSAAGLWHHIVGPQSQDLGIWSTGNAWAAAGMSRVLATATKSRHSGDTKVKSGIAQVKDIVKAILDGAIARDNAEPGEPLLGNYLNDTTWFGELSGTTLLTATAYRMARLEPREFGPRYTEWADSKREVIMKKISSDGLLSPVVNPLNWGDRTPRKESPEAQSFAILMLAAHRDFTSR
ncbi:uncharacterized protein F4812DRAFT_456158 [Daldinia caldariorum]|uniref:uncharacterized protein n=1 Tax=Daldinia caldariorum TaxID=326644 RepID=UPI002008A99C|nr:uncharacterized protein F4812DRAFT_456158 [Daldinia caldariorum]KAI1472061.1 hypothetical protein F4812DRAFT_456158 [Daldinia caldariorum]